MNATRDQIKEYGIKNINKCINYNNNSLNVGDMFRLLQKQFNEYEGYYRSIIDEISDHYEDTKKDKVC
jgi:hypothetical protein